MLNTEENKGPRGDQTVATESFCSTISVADGATHVTDLSDSNHFNGTQYQNRTVEIIATQNMNYFWTNNASATIDNTAVDGTNRAKQGHFVPANTKRVEVGMGRYLCYQLAAAGKIYVAVIDKTKAY